MTERPGLPPLLVDRMLGRLARWLRLLGADAEVWNGVAEDELLGRLRGGGRLLVTRHRRRAARLQGLRLPVLLLTADDLGAQLREVARRFALPPAAARFSRCGWCNEPLRTAGSAEAGPWVPPFVARTQEHFARCPRCGRFFWHATQPGRLARDLVRFLGPDPASANGSSRSGH